MRLEKRQARRQAIEEAAYALLEENGFAATSMLSIARRARASNETLYRWYGDKQGLYRSLIESNANEVRTLLERDLGAGVSPMTTLQALGPRLLTLLTSDKAVALNRAAAADPTGTLGATLAEFGRNAVVPLIARVLEAARDAGDLFFEQSETAAELYLGLLIGDLQIRRVIGAIPQPSPPMIKRRAAAALSATCKLLSADRPS